MIKYDQNYIIPCSIESIQRIVKEAQSFKLTWATQPRSMECDLFTAQVITTCYTVCDDIFKNKINLMLKRDASGFKEVVKICLKAMRGRSTGRKVGYERYIQA
jgi:hypothetical protein